MEEEPEAQNLVLYACVARGKKILAHFLDGDPVLATAVTESLASLPKLHRTVSFTTNDRTACYLISPPFTYCGVFEEGFGKEESFAFLHKVAEELRRIKGADDQDHGLVNMHLVIRSLVNSANGLQQTDDDSFDDCVPLMSRPRLERRLSSGESHKALTRVKSGNRDKKKSKEQQHQQQQSHEMREISEQSQEKVAEDDQAESSGSRSSKTVRSGQRRCWCSVKVIVVVDVALCILLVVVWLVVCRGFRCS